MKSAREVALRSLSLELLLQRLGLELDDDEPAEARNAYRKAWLAYHKDLGVEQAITSEERAFFDRPVDELTQDEVDVIEGHILQVPALLWALGCIPELPTSELLGQTTGLVTASGLLGDGSVSKACSRVTSAALRPDSELQAACDSARRARGDVSESMTSEQMLAGIHADALTWVLGVAPV